MTQNAHEEMFNWWLDNAPNVDDYSYYLGFTYALMVLAQDMGFEAVAERAEMLRENRRDAHLNSL